MKSWALRLSYHLNYWLIMALLLGGIYWQRTNVELLKEHIKKDHKIMERLVNGPPPPPMRDF